MKKNFGLSFLAIPSIWQLPMFIIYLRKDPQNLKTFLNRLL